MTLTAEQWSDLKDIDNLDTATEEYNNMITELEDKRLEQEIDETVEMIRKLGYKVIGKCSICGKRQVKVPVDSCHGEVGNMCVSDEIIERLKDNG